MSEPTPIDVIEGQSRWSLHRGSCLDLLRSLPDNCADACVTDGPYELGFMGRSWDGTGIVYRVELWQEMLRVLKPGAHLLSFGGTRTYHRMACAIEDAGFDVRDSIHWIYGCLSDDTDALTRRGWVRGTELLPSDDVMQWDTETGELSWARPSKIHLYDYNGRMVHLRNRHTDQVLTPNHRVFCTTKKHSRETEWTRGFIEAGAMKRAHVAKLPMAGLLQGDGGPTPDIAYLVGWWLTDAWKHGGGKAIMFSQCKPSTLAKLRDALALYSPSEYTKKPKKPQHAVEHTFYVSGELAEYMLANHPDRELTWGMLSWNTESRVALWRGLMDGDGSQPECQEAHAFWSKKQERRDIFLALCVSLGMRAFDAPEKSVVNVNIGTDSTELQYKHRVSAPDVDYCGKVWCVTVPTGAFVARRNGRPFITGNSGFPHYLNVSKAIDKADGLSDQRVVTSTYTASGNAGTSTKDKGGTFAVGAENSPPIELKRTIGATDKSRAWDGWATALRPSHEPIVVARKPFDGTVVDNILTNGVGALNIDACRVPRNASAERGESWAKSGNTAQPGAGKIAVPPGNGINSHPLGGWPGNVVMTHDARCSEISCVPGCPCHTMGEMSGNLSNGGQNATSDRAKIGELCYGEYGPDSEPTRFAGDSGTAARYFNQSRWTEQDDPNWPGFYYCSKAGTAERELGCEKLEKRSAAKLTESHEGAARLNCPSTGAGRTSEGRANFHPTVKPLELMRWLCKLVTPKNGIIIEPFGGSGSGVMAPILEGFRCIASELTEDYWPIIEARVVWAERERFNATRQLQLFG
jgi:site-specific DNA-methyltransferase (adenine-specific)